MIYLEIALKAIVGLSILNVWLVRANRKTPYRGGDAGTIKEEFAIYGLPAWFMTVTGTVKVVLSLALILSIWLPILEFYATVGIAILMTGAIAMHVRVRDPLIKMMPAALFLMLSLFIYFM